MIMIIITILVGLLCLFCAEAQSGHTMIFTARCTLVQSAVLRSHVVCPSVRL